MAFEKIDTNSAGQTADYWRVFRWATRIDAAGVATTDVHFQGFIDKESRDAGNDPAPGFVRKSSVSGSLSGVDSHAVAYTATKAGDDFFKDALDV